MPTGGQIILALIALGAVLSLIGLGAKDEPFEAGVKKPGCTPATAEVIEAATANLENPNATLYNAYQREQDGSVYFISSIRDPKDRDLTRVTLAFSTDLGDARAAGSDFEAVIAPDLGDTVPPELLDCL